MSQALAFETLGTFVDEAPPRRPWRFWPRLKRFGRAIASGLEWTFGAASLVVGLSVLAALPIAQFLSLGYLLEASGKVAKGGRLRDGWIGVRRAARVGGVVAGAWLSLLPGRLASSLATSAELIDPDGPVARAWRGILAVVVLATLVHVAGSCARGGAAPPFRLAAGDPDLAGRAAPARGGSTSRPATRPGRSSRGSACRITSGWASSDSWARRPGWPCR